MSKENVCVCEKYYSAVKNMDLPFTTATWMDLEDIILSEINQRKINPIWCYVYL